MEGNSAEEITSTYAIKSIGLGIENKIIPIWMDFVFS